MFMLLNTGIAVLIVIAVVIAYAVIQNSLAGAQGTWFPELFNVNTRSSGASMAYEFSAVVSGSTPSSSPCSTRPGDGLAPPPCSASTA